MKLMKKSKLLVLTLILVVVLGTFVGCGQREEPSPEGNDNQQDEGNGGAVNLSGAVEIDGSSTVYRITEAVAEEFQKENQDVKVTVGVSGTGGGFKRFKTGDTDISNASRHIKDEEAADTRGNGIEFSEIPVAYDGISVVVNPANDFVDNLTVEELTKIWEPDSRIKTWQDVRGEWPAEEIKLYGPGTDSGTFDYFTDEINGEEGASRTDYTASEDDNVLIQGVAGDKYALGYFGYAYYAENTDKLKVVPIEGVTPDAQTIENGDYWPLSREIFIYVSHNSIKNKPQVAAFVTYYLQNADALVPEVGYVSLGESKYQELLQTIEAIK